MHHKKNVISGFLILLFIMTILTSCGGNDMSFQKSTNDFSKIIKKGDFEDLSLRIYFISPSILTRQPLSINDLLTINDLQEIVVNGNDLKKHADLLEQVSSCVLAPIEKETHLDARIYYVFETKKARKILSVAMWGEDNSIFVNGQAFEYNEIFRDIIIPFLPENIVEELKP